MLAVGFVPSANSLVDTINIVRVDDGNYAMSSTPDLT